MNRLEKLKDNVQKKEIKQFFIMLKPLQGYIQKLKERDENITVKNVKDKIYSEIYDVHMIVDQHNGKKVLSSGKNDLFFLYTIQYILKNPKVISQAYHMVVEDDRDVFLEEIKGREYGEDIRKNIIFIVNECIRAQEKRYKNRVKNLPQEDIESITKQICAFCKDMIEKEKFEERIKRSYIKRLSRMISFLDEFGDLEIYNDLNNKRLERMDLLDELGFEYKQEGKNDYKITTIMDLKDEKSLEKLSLEELTVLISFYLNRIEKTTENIERVFFSLEKRGLLGRFYNGEDIEQKLSDEDVRLNLSQYKFLIEYGETLLRRFADDNINDNERWMFYSKDDILEYMEEEETRDYKAFVKANDKSLQANLKKDVEEIQGLVSFRHNLYFYKDKFMEIMMYHLLTDSKNINWGYVEEINKFNGYNSIQNNSRNILIKADLAGFNNPITLHYSLNKLRDFMKNFNGTKKIPVYQGEEDFTVERMDGSQVYMSNFLLMPLQNSRRKKLIKKSQTIPEDSIYYKYIKHLVWISSPKSVPPHLMKNGKNVKQMVDLESGEIEEVDNSTNIR